MSPIVKRILNILGIVAAVGVAILVPLLSSMPTGTAWTVRLGIALAVLSTLSRAFGPATTGPVPANELDSNPKTSNVVAFPGPATPAAGTPRRDGGSTPGLPVALLVLAGSLLWGSTAWAQSPVPGPSYGGCFAGGVLCAGPSASITVVSFNLATSSFTGGVSPGVGYGLTYTPPSAPWAAVGLDLYASVRLGQNLPNMAAFSLMGHFANYVFLGVGPTVTQEPAGVPAVVQWSILGGFGVPLGLSAYQAKAAASVETK